MIRVHVTDPDVLRSVDPADLRTYLVSKGWAQARVNQNLWTLDDDLNSAQILIPGSNRMRGYVGFMRDALRTLAEVEDRPELEILAQINAPMADVQYIKTYPSTASGTTPIIDGVKAFESAKQWVMTGAVAAASGRNFAIQPRRKPARALDFLRDVRLGQTFPGSFVLSIQIPLSLRVGLYQLALEHPELDRQNIPFERVVSTQLYESTAAALHAASIALDSRGDVSYFHEAVSHGVSADLCESLAGFGGEPGSQFSLGFTWASTYPIDDRGPLDFSTDHVQILSSAAQMLREIEPEENIRLIGSVVRLHREGGLGVGEVSILGVIEGDANEKMHRVWLTLDEEQYRIANTAHTDGSIVSVRGTLIKKRSRTELSVPYDFDVVSTP